MKIIIVNDAGKVETIKCKKIEPATLSRDTRIIVDEGEHVINLADIIVITD